MEQAPPNAAPWEAGFVWQDAQSVGVPLNTPPTWHLAHAIPIWAPVSGNRDREWSNRAPAHEVVEWQAAQSLPNDPLCLSLAA